MRSWRIESANLDGILAARRLRPRSCARLWTSHAQKTDLARAVASDGRFPVKVVTETFGVARSNLIDRLKGKTKSRRRYQKAKDAELVPRIATLVTARPTYGYRPITAIPNRQLRLEGLAPAIISGSIGSCRRTTFCWRGNIPNAPSIFTTARSSSCARQWA